MSTPVPEEFTPLRLRPSEDLTPIQSKVLEYQSINGKLKRPKPNTSFEETALEYATRYFETATQIGLKLDVEIEEELEGEFWRVAGMGEDTLHDNPKAYNGALRTMYLIATAFDRQFITLMDRDGPSAIKPKLALNCIKYLRKIELLVERKEREMMG